MIVAPSSRTRDSASSPAASVGHEVGEVEIGGPGRSTCEQQLRNLRFAESTGKPEHAPIAFLRYADPAVHGAAELAGKASFKSQRRRRVRVRTGAFARGSERRAGDDHRQIAAFCERLSKRWRSG